MSLNMFWFLPTHGDGHYLGTEEGSRPVDHGYLQQIAQAADRLGYTGVLIPTGRSCEDAWLVAASMIPVTQRLKFLVALRPSVTSPTVAARQAATLDRLSNGRALFNLVTGSDPQELAGDGVFLDHSERYEASAEFTRVWRRLLLGETVNFNGKHIHVRGAKLLFPPIQQPYPPLYFGGSSDVAQSWRQNKLISTSPGRTARTSKREDRTSAGESCRAWTQNSFRYSSACDCS